MSEPFWNCIDTLALALAMDGTRDEKEESLDDLQRAMQGLDSDDRADVRRKIKLIVAQLARLEYRLHDADGPLGTAV